MLRSGNNANSSSCKKIKIQGTATAHTRLSRHILSIHVFDNAHNNHTRLTYSAGSTFGSKLSDQLVQYIKQINTYIYSTDIENEG